MGKSLVIKGVNYRPNSLIQQIQRLSWIGLSDRNNSADFDDCPNGRYISSGITFNTGLRFSIRFQTGTDKYSIMLPGSRFSNDTDFQAWIQPGGIQVFFGGQGMLVQPNSRTISVNLWDGEEHTIDFCKERIVLDGETYSWIHTAITKESSRAPIYLDCSSMSDGTVNTYAKGTINEGGISVTVPVPTAIKLKEIKIWSDYNSESSLIIDAIPARRLSDQAVGFYNLINGEFHLRNDGSIPAYGV